MATNLENLEYSRDFSEHGKLREFSGNSASLRLDVLMGVVCVVGSSPVLPTELVGAELPGSSQCLARTVQRRCCTTHRYLYTQVSVPVLHLTCCVPFVMPPVSLTITRFDRLNVKMMLIRSSEVC